MKSEDLKLFLRSLQTDLQRLNRLSELLDEQYLLMGQRQALALEPVNAKALHLMEALRLNQQRRDKMLESLGLANSKERMRLLLSLLPESLRLKTTALLKELSLKSQTCQAKNEKSGMLLATQRQLMQKLTGLSRQDSYPQLEF